MGTKVKISHGNQQLVDSGLRIGARICIFHKNTVMNQATVMELASSSTKNVPLSIPTTPERLRSRVSEQEQIIQQLKRKHRATSMAAEKSKKKLKASITAIKNAGARKKIIIETMDEALQVYVAVAYTCMTQ